MQNLIVTFKVGRTDKVEDIRVLHFKTDNLSTEWQDLYEDIYYEMENHYPELNPDTLGDNIVDTLILEVKNDKGTLIRNHDHEVIKAFLSKDFGMEELLEIEKKSEYIYRVRFTDTDGNIATGIVGRKDGKTSMQVYGLED